MRKRSALTAWKLLLLALPRGIAMFVVAVAGICAGLPLAIVGVGIPILAGTLSWLSKMKREDERRWEAWHRGGKETPAANRASAAAADGDGSAWRKWFGTILRPESLRAAGYAILQFPVSIAMFVVAVAIPATILALVVSPAAYKVSMFLYQFELFNDAEVMQMLLPPLSPFERSLVVAGIGFFLLLFVPALLRMLGSLYDGVVDIFAEPERPEQPQAEYAETQYDYADQPAQIDSATLLARAEAAISRYDESRPPAPPSSPTH
ncbi:sensor domain-containing protein [Cohnella sp. REN36]|uniref:sensor domain-containing protein n=1 Tax=Cohnella sp. REN36 TaxID=2887347 RepID=UPI001D13A15A|nr:sensor domain-containing protein [Cohnella sp. REN36]MCC3374571.1 sensor domain-containing protein [Cohnella sp. REN36]